MKRLIKLLSIFGVLIILGSCSSSKSVNVTENITDTGYYNVTYKPSITVSGVTYTVIGEISCIPYTSNDGEKQVDYSPGVQITDLIKENGTYTLKWEWEASNGTSGFGSVQRTFNSGSPSIDIYFLSNSIRVQSN